MAKDSGLTVQLKAVLDECSAELKDAMEKELKAVSKEAVKMLKSSSPKKTGEYASGWTAKKDGKGFIIYNKKAPYLTHLLENGHLIKNKKGTYGRTRPIKHIKPVEEWANEELPRRIMEDMDL